MGTDQRGAGLCTQAGGRGRTPEGGGAVHTNGGSWALTRGGRGYNKISLCRSLDAKVLLVMR